MATFRRRTFSGAIGACLLGVSVGLGWVLANPSPASAADAAPLAVPGDACPVGWPALRGGDGGGAFDGHVSVLVGGDLRVAGRASGAEGVVVVRGTASVARDEPGPYLVGVTGTGSQVTPHPGSDMLVVGGDLAAAPASPVEIAPALDGDAAVGGAVAAGTALSLGGGRLDQGVADVLAPYDALLAGLAAKSASYAALPVTGSVEVTDSAVVLVGDGESPLQVMAVDAALLGQHDRAGRTLRVRGVPDGAAVVVNLVGPDVALDVDALRGADGGDLDAAADAPFGDLATHLLWNAPTARAVTVSGEAQLPGSLLVGSAASTTTLDGAGTNGRVLVAGDLVHTGGELHSYPFVADPDLACGPDLAHRGTFTLDVVLDDPGGLVDPEQPFHGTYRCLLDGADVTPGDGTWRVRAIATERVIASGVPVGAVCTVDEQLVPPSGPAWAWEWEGPAIAPASVTVAKRDPRGFTVTNTVRPAPAPPPGTQEPEEPDDPVDPVDPETEPETPTTQDPTTSEPVDPPPVLPDPHWSDDADAGAETAAESAADLELLRPSETPLDQSGQTGPDAEPDADEDTEVAATPAPDATGPLTTTAPYSLRGAFVWAPLLLLSVLALRLRFPWRYKRRRRLY